MDKRKAYYLMIDTEATNCLNEQNKVDATHALVYDIGFAVIDKKGNFYETYSFVISEVFDGFPDLMQSAYYAKKLPQYRQDIETGRRKKVTMGHAKRTLRDVCNRYNVKSIVGHNIMFDFKAVTNTEKVVTNGRYTSFFPYQVPLWDTLKMAKCIFPNKPSYTQFCEKHNYLNYYQKPQMTAEALFAYVNGTPDFTEAHTALEDVQIEAAIFTYMLRQKKKMEKELFKKDKKTF